MCWEAYSGTGKFRLPLISVSIACLVNIAGDLLLVGVFHMASAGAAIATVFAQAVSVVLSILIIRKQKLPCFSQGAFVMTGSWPAGW
ncbi:MAG: polysaccharide biosynthesis C-terminal domain-containing protein [Ruminococcus sp.]